MPDFDVEQNVASEHRLPHPPQGFSIQKTVFGLWEKYSPNLSKQQKALRIGKDLVELTYKGTPLKFKFSNVAEKKSVAVYVYENFIDETYKSLDVSDKVVIDVGSGFCESPIYFVLNGAKRVVGYDIDQHSHQSGMKNVELNSMQDKIILKNTEFSFADLQEYEGLDLALKMDIEGGEYPLILNARKEELRMFSEIIMEYHYGYLNLMNKLKDCGFVCELINAPVISMAAGLGYVGRIHAKRI